MRDYEILYRAGNEWKMLRRVEKNHQRVNRNRFDAVETTGIRIRVHAANGIDEARIFEVRCYA